MKEVSVTIVCNEEPCVVVTLYC